MTNRLKMRISSIVAALSLFLALKFTFDLYDPNNHNAWNIAKVFICLVIFFASIAGAIIFDAKAKIDKGSTDSETNIIAREQRKTWQMKSNKGGK